MTRCAHCGEPTTFLHNVFAPDDVLWYCTSCKDRLDGRSMTGYAIALNRRKRQLQSFEHIITGTDRHISRELYQRLLAFQKLLRSEIRILEDFIQKSETINAGLSGY